ncbi:MAG: cystathionine gamma-synthase [Actinomycetota bacterium]|nr:cystathionine gamma-synthase [Actinomycetota bacterium]
MTDPTADSDSSELSSTELSLAPATVAVTAGRPPRVADGPLNAPLVPASTYHAGGEIGYGRYGNPTWEMFETAIGALEGGVATSYSSGVAATAAVLDLVPAGGVVVAPTTAYHGTTSLLRALTERGRFVVRALDLSDLDAVLSALPGADLLWVETPSNPLLVTADLPGLVSAGGAAGALVAVDNTFATPVLCRPLEMGADLVVHSATKYLSGHADVVLGVAVARDPDLVERLVATRGTQGALPGLLESWLALRGLRTLHVRMERAQANAVELARRLAGHESVSRVRYPGFGAIVSVEIRGGADEATRVSEGTRLWVHATSLGGVESTLERRRRWPSEGAEVPDSLLRLSVGIEDVEDLWSDLSRALDPVLG